MCVLCASRTQEMCLKSLHYEINRDIIFFITLIKQSVPSLTCMINMRLISICMYMISNKCGRLNMCKIDTKHQVLMLCHGMYVCMLNVCKKDTKHQESFGLCNLNTRDLVAYIHVHMYNT